MERVRSRMLDRWALPPAVPGNQSVQLRFTLDPAGTASRVELVAAPEARLGQSAVEALRAASPFDHMPDRVRCLARAAVGTFGTPCKLSAAPLRRARRRAAALAAPLPEARPRGSASLSSCSTTPTPRSCAKRSDTDADGVTGFIYYAPAASPARRAGHQPRRPQGRLHLVRARLRAARPPGGGHQPRRTPRPVGRVPRRQAVADAYRGQLRLVRTRLVSAWRSRTEAMNREGTTNAAVVFKTLVPPAGP
jgi:hypothetical protein